jgi:hypothetical protein
LQGVRSFVTSFIPPSPSGKAETTKGGFFDFQAAPAAQPAEAKDKGASQPAPAPPTGGGFFAGIPELPTFDSSKLPSVNLPFEAKMPDLPTFSSPQMPTVNMPQFEAKMPDLPTFEGPRMPSVSMPDLPKMPDLATFPNLFDAAGSGSAPQTSSGSPLEATRTDRGPSVSMPDLGVNLPGFGLFEAGAGAGAEGQEGAAKLPSFPKVADLPAFPTLFTPGQAGAGEGSAPGDAGTATAGLWPGEIKLGGLNQVFSAPSFAASTEAGDRGPEEGQSQQGEGAPTSSSFLGFNVTGLAPEAAGKGGEARRASLFPIEVSQV